MTVSIKQDGLVRDVISAISDLDVLINDLVRHPDTADIACNSIIGGFAHKWLSCHAKGTDCIITHGDCELEDLLSQLSFSITGVRIDDENYSTDYPLQRHGDEFRISFKRLFIVEDGRLVESIHVSTAKVMCLDVKIDKDLNVSIDSTGVSAIILSGTASRKVVFKPALDRAIREIERLYESMDRAHKDQVSTLVNAMYERVAIIGKRVW